MEPAQNSTAGMVWYNCSSVEGFLTSGAPVQVEIGSDISRQLNQHIQIQYSNFAALPSQPQQHIIVAHQPIQQEVIPAASGEPEEPVPSPQGAKASSPQKNKAKTVSVGDRVPCTQCGKTFSCNANLRDHVRLHTGERPFSCSECGMSFAQRSNWRLHKRVHTGERPYMCGICGKTFSRSSHLPGHMRVHTGERPFQCDSCEHAFGSAQALKNHMRTHTGEKPFVCDFCRTPFTHSSSLSSHKKRCNGEKRKRGRPLGSGRRSFKKKTTGRRGRPRKRSGGKFQKRGRTKKLKVEAPSSPLSSDSKSDRDSSLNTIILNGQEHSIKLETSSSSKITAGEMMEISVEVINTSDTTQEERKTACDLLSQEVVETVRPNESEGLAILPDNGHVLVEEDVVRAAASAAGLTDATDLHQEAAVAMAALHHAPLNLVHSTSADGSFVSSHGSSPQTTTFATQGNPSQTTTWYLKQD